MGAGSLVFESRNKYPFLFLRYLNVSADRRLTAPMSDSLFYVR
jgi:hypothetical protein